MNILAYLLSLLFACNILLEVASIENNEYPEQSNQIGSAFSINSSHNETKTENKLRLRKGYVKKTLLRDSFGAKIPVAEFKASGVEELLPCKELDVGTRINCKPIAAHIIDETVRLDSTTIEFDQYVRRGSYRLKMKFNYLFELGSREELLLYPLQDEFTLNEILSRGRECDIDDEEFFKNNLNLGHYFEFKILKTDKTAPILKCNGYSFLSVNQTQIYERQSHDSDYPEFADQFEHLLMQAINNGYLFSLRDVACRTGEFSLFSLDIDFTIVQRKQFPYLTVKHYMETQPLSMLFNYNSSVTQKIYSKLGVPLYYTTEIDIDSNSIVDWLDFKLHQKFVYNGSEILESMQFLSKSLKGITVNSVFNETAFIKLVKYFEIEKETLILKSGMVSDDYIKELFEIVYADKAGESSSILVKYDKKRMLRHLEEVFELSGIKERDPTAEEENQKFNEKDPIEIYSIFDEL